MAEILTQQNTMQELGKECIGDGLEFSSTGSDALDTVSLVADGQDSTLGQEKLAGISNIGDYTKNGPGAGVVGRQALTGITEMSEVLSDKPVLMASKPGLKGRDLVNDIIPGTKKRQINTIRALVKNLGEQLKSDTRVSESQHRTVVLLYNCRSAFPELVTDESWLKTQKDIQDVLALFIDRKKILMTRLAKKNHRYNRPLSEEDLVSESVVGLLEGLGRADLGHKGSVGSFCDFNILRGCGDAIRKKGNTLAQSPTDMRRKRRYLRLLYEGNDRSWRPEEVAQRMDVPLRLINKSLSNLRQTGLIYINARHGNSDTQPDDEDVDTHEELAVEDSDIEKEAVLAAEGGLGLLAILEGSGLISHHQVAMRMYYGLPPFDEEDGEPLLMRDITLALGLTDPSSMSKIKKSSLNRLKLLSGHLREYVK